MKYPFYYKANLKVTEDGWSLYTVENEFDSYFGGEQSEWRISEVNMNYAVSRLKPY
jgi:hypothetical protein